MLGIRSNVLVLVLVLAHSLLAGVAQASLGDSENSIEADRQALRGTRTSEPVSRRPYRVHAIHVGDRQTVREYVTLDGNVFAVTWRGAHQPDLAQLFGAYFIEYAQSEATTPVPAGRAPKVTSSTNVTVYKFGHMGDVRGKAVITQFLPDGVTPGELR